MVNVWDTPNEWLEDHARQENRRGVLDILTLIIQDLDPDVIQDLFQEEMDEDGYFEEAGNE